MTSRQRQRQRRAHRNHGGAKQGVLIALSLGIVVGFLAVLGVVGYIISVAASAPSIDSLKPIDHGTTSSIYAANGKRLGFITADELRTPVTTQDIPQSVKQATVAIEDQRFYQHKGVDYEGVVRAGLKNLESGQTVQGGSTITMQLVRNLFTGDRNRNFQRKIKEAKLAEELEKEHNKNWILTNYLNNVAYGTVGGSTAVGVQAAARVFFDKRVNDLSLAESALLAGLPQAPSVYNPFRDPRVALRRRNEVLSKMAKLNMIPSDEALQAQHEALGVRDNTYYSAKRESYFFDYVKEQLTERYGANTVRKGGLKVYTTIDLNLQKLARKSIDGVLNESGDPSSAIVSINPANGYIRAMASSGSYGHNKFNYAVQGHRQPGSSFKTMVLMTALRQGIDPRTTYYTSKPLDLNTKFGPWKVQTYSGGYGGSMSLVQATLQSDNTVFAQLDLDVGPDAVRQTAYDMGIKTKLDGYPAEGLGGLSLGVSPLEMANAYATIASGGYRNEPIAIRRVVFPDGKSEDLGKPKRTKVFSDGITYEATKILHANMLGGTATRANISCPAAAKTGTTDDFTDAWLVGFTPKMATSVWIGYPGSKVPMDNVHGIRVNGGSLPAQIWHDYMSVAHGKDCSNFRPPSEPANLSSGGSNGGRNGGSSGYYGPDSGGIYPNIAPGGTATPAPNGGFDPNQYEAPPQGAPTPTPEPSPSPAPAPAPPDNGGAAQDGTPGAGGQNPDPGIGQ
jgi:penicillin-binding protein 1A